MGRSSWGCGFAELGADRFQFFELRHAVLRPLPADPGCRAARSRIIAAQQPKIRPSVLSSSPVTTAKIPRSSPTSAEVTRPWRDNRVANKASAPPIARTTVLSTVRRLRLAASSSMLAPSPSGATPLAASIAICRWASAPFKLVLAASSDRRAARIKVTASWIAPEGFSVSSIPHLPFLSRSHQPFGPVDLIDCALPLVSEISYMGNPTVPRRKPKDVFLG